MFSTCLDNFVPFSSNLKLSSAKSFSLEESKICRLVMVSKVWSYGKWLKRGKIYFNSLLTHYQMTNSRLFQTERLCRRQFQIWRIWQKAIQTGRKHCGKRRNCSHGVFKRLVSLGRQKVLLCGNGLINVTIWGKCRSLFDNVLFLSQKVFLKFLPRGWKKPQLYHNDFFFFYTYSNTFCVVTLLRKNVSKNVWGKGQVTFKDYLFSQCFCPCA